MLVQPLATDAVVAAGAFAGTHVLYGETQRYLKAHLSSWDQIKPATQNRMACEIALLPSRLAMFFCCLPIIVNSFNPTHMWMPSDTARSILACAIMAGCYCYDLLIERNDVLSLIHHFMGPTMLVWIRISFANGTSTDATMIRLLMSFVFFGAACGGSMTTSILVLMKLLKADISEATMYRYVSKFVWALTVNTFLATTFGTLYMLVWSNELLAYWGNYAFIPLLLSSFEFYLQWRWAFRFQNIQDHLWIKSAGGKPAGKPAAKVDLLEAVKTKYIVLRSVVGVWSVCYVAVYAKAANHAALTLL